jgi:hypothetical protein
VQVCAWTLPILHGNKRDVPQSQPSQPPVPSPGERPRLGDVPWLIAFSLRGLFELIRARIIFDRLQARDIPLRNQRIVAAHQAEGIAQAAETARIGYVLPRLSKRLPWRSDCLVQAIAGQNWLAALGLASEIQIGVERPAGKPFAAHAWLVHGGSVVTGGDISIYQRLLGDIEVSAQSPDRADTTGLD